MAGSVNAAEAQAVPDVQCHADVLRKLLEHEHHPCVVQRAVAGLGGGNRNQGQPVVLMYLGPFPESGKCLCHLLDSLLLVLPVRSALAVEAFLEVGDQPVRGRIVPAFALRVFVGCVFAPEVALCVGREVTVIRSFEVADHRQARRHPHANSCGVLSNSRRMSSISRTRMAPRCSNFAGQVIAGF